MRLHIGNVLAACLFIEILIHIIIRLNFIWRMDQNRASINKHYPPYIGKSFERLHGRSYPQWASTVSSTLKTIQSQSVKRWGPVIPGPKKVAKPKNRISAGWAYSDVSPNGVAYLQNHTICVTIRATFNIYNQKRSKHLQKVRVSAKHYSWCTLWICLYNHFVCRIRWPQ